MSVAVWMIAVGLLGLVALAVALRRVQWSGRSKRPRTCASDLAAIPGSVVPNGPVRERLVVRTDGSDLKWRKVLCLQSNTSRGELAGYVETVYGLVAVQGVYIPGDRVAVHLAFTARVDGRGALLCERTYPQHLTRNQIVRRAAELARESQRHLSKVAA